MSLSCSDCFSDLLCGEASTSIIYSGGGEDSPEYSSDFDSRPPDAEEFIAGLLEDERDLASIGSCRSVAQPIDAPVRSESVAWILKVQRYYGFQPLTGYLSVNYFDRFISCHQLPKKACQIRPFNVAKKLLLLNLKMNGWPMQLLAVACLSLAAKMEERLVPSLLDLQVEEARFIFEPRTIQRMELLVLRVLDWRLRSISPFCYLPFFALKIDPSGTYAEFFTTRAREIIFSTMQEASFLECRPSCIAAATILCAANDLPKFSLITAQHAESWCDGLLKDEIMSCDELIRQGSIRMKVKKQAKVFPQVQVTSRASITSADSSPSSLSSSSFKRKDSSWRDESEGGMIKRVKNQDLHN